MDRTKTDERSIADLIRFGTIAEVRLGDDPAILVDLDEGAQTDWIPWLAFRAGKTRSWSPPSAGEQVVLLCPEGDIESAVALLGLYSTANPAPGSGLAELIAYEDGAWIGYDPVGHVLTAALPDGATASITASGGITITGDVTITGNLNISGTAEAAEDVIGGGISLKSHKHGLVAAGTAKSGGPE